MQKEIIEERELFNGLKLELAVSLDPYENPNDVFGIWTQADGHQAGVTVKDEIGNTGFWISCNYTPAQLAKEYAEQGRENPSREAYESLQRELHHYLHGNMFSVMVTVTLDGEELAGDSIGFDYSDYDAGPGETLEDRAREVARDHFDYRALIREARREAGDRINRLSRIA